MKHLCAVVGAAILLGSPASGPAQEGDQATEGGVPMAMTVTSTAFESGKPIPKRFSCGGEDLSPALSWGDAPEGVKSFALICDDPDAPMGTWVHWVIWGIPADSAGLPEGVPADSVKLEDGSIQGINSWGKPGYGGPCPPPGKPHRYFFKVYALDAQLDLSVSSDKAALEAAMEGHVLAQAELMGTYQR